MRVFWAVEKSEKGWFGVAVTEKGLYRSRFFDQTKKNAEISLLKTLSREAEEIVEDSLSCRQYIRELKDYFSGKRKHFSFQLDMTRLTSFTKKVLKAVRYIPYGTVRSYGWGAQKAGSPKAARAVGQVMARNPFAPVVPCHRVIASDGSLGGFGGGPALKKWLLELEKKNV